MDVDNHLTVDESDVDYSPEGVTDLWKVARERGLTCPAELTKVVLLATLAGLTSEQLDGILAERLAG